MAAGTIVITVTESGKADLTKTYNVPDVQVVTDAYTPLATGTSTTTATRTQTWLYVSDTWKKALVSVVKQFNTVPAVIPSDINIT